MSASIPGTSNIDQTSPSAPSAAQPKGLDPSVLLPREVFWGRHQTWLGQRGYQLRPRYRQGWVPSWKGKDEEYWNYEDGLYSMRGQVLDATRISDGEMVMLKRVSRTTHPHEIEISQMFSEEPLRSHPKNHCVPIFEVLDVPDEEDLSILVLPLLRSYNDPRLKSVGEAVEYIRQVFEGLQFMHQNHVAHRDCMDLNIMMDPRPVYPDMYHPRSLGRTPDLKGRAKYYTRTAKPVKYYLIDFGLSRKYNAENASPREEPIWGGDKTVPEFQDSDDPRDPYLTDIYYLGNMIREDFLQKTRGLEFMTPLVNDMVQADPTKRPTIHEVVERFDKISRSLHWWTLRSRLLEEGESTVNRLVRGTRHYFRTTAHILTFRSALPTPPRSPQHFFKF